MPVDGLAFQQGLGPLIDPLFQLFVELLQGQLILLAIGHIQVDANQPLGHPGLIAGDNGMGFHKANLPIGTDDAKFYMVVPLSGDGSLNLWLNAEPVFGM